MVSIHKTKTMKRIGRRILMLSSSIESFFGSFSLFLTAGVWKKRPRRCFCTRLWSVSRVKQRSADMVVALPGLVRSNPWEPRPDDWDTVYWEEEGQHQETGAGSKIWNRGEGEGV